MKPQSLDNNNHDHKPYDIKNIKYKPNNNEELRLNFFFI